MASKVIYFDKCARSYKQPIAVSSSAGFQATRSSVHICGLNRYTQSQPSYIMPSAWDSYGPAPPGTGDLSPLPPKLRIGLEVIGALAVLSLLLCSALFLFITCRLVDGLRKETRRRKHLQLRASPNDSLDCNNASFEMGSPKGPRSPFSSHTPVSPCLKGGAVSTTQQLQDRSSVESRRVVMPNIRQRYKGYHPLLVLIYMLLIADIIQSASMIPNLVWVAHNAITVRSETCWAQGWLRSQGDSECC